jgi:hypothetical protein
MTSQQDLNRSNGPDNISVPPNIFSEKIYVYKNTHLNSVAKAAGLLNSFYLILLFLSFLFHSVNFLSFFVALTGYKSHQLVLIHSLGLCVFLTQFPCCLSLLYLFLFGQSNGRSNGDKTGLHLKTLRQAKRRRQRQGQHHRQGHRHLQRQRRQDKAWEVAGIVLAVPYIIRRLRSSTAIYYI